jgi:hypothetical protein
MVYFVGVTLLIIHVFEITIIATYCIKIPNKFLTADSDLPTTIFFDT